MIDYTGEHEYRQGLLPLPALLGDEFGKKKRVLLWLDARRLAQALAEPLREEAGRLGERLVE
ncbi:MAG: hypothetical protein FWD39_04605 [Clostridiales bacterium]|nr:hypothetical protein [Clostridiales bacterium]